jgi:hypothetical protein
MVNNLMNHYFYDIKKQWNCAGVFLNAQRDYSKKLADELKSSIFTYTDKWHDLRKTNIDTYWDFENSVASENHYYNKNYSNISVEFLFE